MSTQRAGVPAVLLLVGRLRMHTFITERPLVRLQVFSLALVPAVADPKGVALYPRVATMECHAIFYLRGRVDVANLDIYNKIIWIVWPADGRMDVHVPMRRGLSFCRRPIRIRRFASSAEGMGNLNILDRGQCVGLDIAP